MRESNESTRGLFDRRQEAIELVALGRTDAEVAEQVGVTRITVTDWRFYDPDFAAALNRRRAELCVADVCEPVAAQPS